MNTDDLIERYLAGPYTEDFDPLYGRAEWVLRSLLDKMVALDYSKEVSTSKKCRKASLQNLVWPRVCRAMWAAGPIKSMMKLNTFFKRFAVDALTGFEPVWNPDDEFFSDIEDAELAYLRYETPEYLE